MQGLAAVPVIIDIGLAILAILIALAWRSWCMSRAEPVRWRAILGPVSLVTATALWAGTILSFSVARYYPIGIVVMFVLRRLLSVVAFLCALALRRRTRWLAMAAALVTFLLSAPNPTFEFATVANPTNLCFEAFFLV